MIIGDVELRSTEFLSRYVLALAGSVAETELCRCQGVDGLMSCPRSRSFIPLAFGECWSRYDRDSVWRTPLCLDGGHGYLGTGEREEC